MRKINTNIKILNIFLLVLIAIGVYLLFTQDKWVTPLTNYILSLEDNKNVNTGSRWTGPISAVNTNCLFDGICSITVSDVEVIVVGGIAVVNNNEKVGKLIGVESVSDVKNYIGKNANVYAIKITNNLYTLYGNDDFYLEVIK